MANERRSLWKAFVASLTGTTLEWYDFALYSVASATIFGTLFFPKQDPLTATLLSFSTYAVGYVARPLGGFVFGRLGDIIGRKHILVVTLVIIGVATCLIGVLPTYDTLGPMAAVLLVVLRFAQGIGVGGEWGGAVLLSSEFGDAKGRGFWASAAQVGPPAGNLLANGVLALFGVILTDQQYMAWGWRVAFLLSAVLVFFGLWVRVKLEETPVFQAIQEKGEQPSAPIGDVFRKQTRGLIAGILCRICPDVLYAMFTVFVLTYATQKLGLPKASAQTAVLIGSGVQIFLMPLAGAISDRINRRMLYLVAAVAAGIWPFVFFPMISSGSLPLLIAGVVVGLIIHAAMYGPQAAFIAEQFAPQLRYTGSSLAYTIAGVLGGAVAPLLFTYLLAKTGNWPSLAVYIAVTAVVTVIGLLLGRDSKAADQEERSTLSVESR